MCRLSASSTPASRNSRRQCVARFRRHHCSPFGDCGATHFPTRGALARNSCRSGDSGSSEARSRLVLMDLGARPIWSLLSVFDLPTREGRRGGVVHALCMQSEIRRKNRCNFRELVVEAAGIEPASGEGVSGSGNGLLGKSSRGRAGGRSPSLVEGCAAAVVYVVLGRGWTS